MAKKIPSWTLKSQAQKRFLSGHPWVFSNELKESPKGIKPGELINLFDAKGKFLATGFGNPQSLISFRVLQRKVRGEEWEDLLLFEKLTAALKLRLAEGFRDSSFRLCFGEADGVPGLIIDRYVVGEDPIQQAQVFVVQCHSAGADRLLEDPERFFESLLKLWSDREILRVPWRNTGIVIKNDISVRSLEGLELEAPKVVREVPGFRLQEVPVRIRSAMGELPITFMTDLVNGQKTGFFLDQFQNIRMGLGGVSGVRPSTRGEPIRVLDLFTYVGQWSVQIGRLLRAMGSSFELVLADSSKRSLGFAERNVKALGAPYECLAVDLLEDMSQFKSKSFDVVICDPPALIKSKKHLGAGTAAYLKLNAEVFRVLKPGGVSIHCSCSYHLGEREFQDVLSEAASEESRAMTWIARGGFSPDHPVLMEFPEGQYLKGWMGVCRE